VLGCRVDRVDMDEAVARIEGFVQTGKAAQVVTLGAEMANLAYVDPTYRAAINGADLVVADTIGIVVAARLLGKPLRERVAGIDLLQRVCAGVASRGTAVFLLGGAPEVAAAAAEALKRAHPGLQIAGTHHGYFADDESPAMCALIKASGARIVFVGLGFPRQEYWIQRNLPNLGAIVCVGVGGSFDVLAGRLPRAPLAVRRVGLEWLYRLMREPRRLRRQLALPVFAARSMRQALFGPR
jgi:N-acetylglucosaminyldiphosphoundecaprenol N-acetyl-beta-D-mannosaminyltransferase